MSTTTGPERTRVPGRRPFRRGWFIGASISLIWTFPVLVELWEGPSVAGHLVGTGIVVAFAAVFMATVPYARVTTSRLHRLLPTVVLFALSLALLPWLGTDIRWMWTFVGVAFAVSAMGRRITWLFVPALSALSFVVGEAMGADAFSNVVNSAIILSISIMMFSFVENISTLERLRAAQEQIAELAAERERGRVARDVHDILGHSLTVITVKAELAGRLMDAGSPAARDEIAQIEGLSRGALADVRATVHGYRGVSISGELPQPVPRSRAPASRPTSPAPPIRCPQTAASSRDGSCGRPSPTWCATRARAPAACDSTTARSRSPTTVAARRPRHPPAQDSRDSANASRPREHG